MKVNSISGDHLLREGSLQDGRFLRGGRLSARQGGPLGRRAIGSSSSAIPTATSSSSFRGSRERAGSPMSEPKHTESVVWAGDERVKGHAERCKDQVGDGGGRNHQWMYGVEAQARAPAGRGELQPGGRLEHLATVQGTPPRSLGLSGVSLRPATAADAPSLTELVRAAYAHYVARLGGLRRPMTDDYAEVVFVPTG